MDEIILSGLLFFGTHGVNPEETALGQRFRVDATVRLDLEGAAQSDDLAHTVSYSAIYKLIRAEMEGAPSKLIEHLAARLLRTILRHDARIQEVEVRVSKLNPPLKGNTTGEAAVAMRRDRHWADLDG
jgi:7,8-dihydroneopterin aldolase/epimerase/oxygenase